MLVALAWSSQTFGDKIPGLGPAQICLVQVRSSCLGSIPYAPTTLLPTQTFTHSWPFYEQIPLTYSAGWHL